MIHHCTGCERILDLVTKHAEATKAIASELERTKSALLQAENDRLLNYVQGSLAIFTAAWLADSHEPFRDYVTFMCDNMEGPEGFDDDEVRQAFGKFRDEIFSRSKGERLRPDWFKGVYDGGKNSHEPET